MNVWIYRNDAVAIGLHVGRHSVAGTQRAVGEPHDRDGAGALEEVSDRIGLRQGSHAAIVVLRGKASPVKDHVGTAAPAVRRSEAPLWYSTQRCLANLKPCRVSLDRTSGGGCPHVVAGVQRLLLVSIFCLNILVASLRTVSEISLLLERFRRSPTSMFFISPSERSSGVRGLKTRLRTMA